MNWEKPNYYMTVDEFAKLVTETLYDSGYFNRDETFHPEDIEVAFTSTAISVARGASYLISKINKSPTKEVFTSNKTTTNIIKNFNELY